jgi:NodT family efflux transporter outer membrane factor (OMF) lipoprotein
MKKLPLILAGCALLAAPGCNLSPTYERPQAGTPGAFKEAVPGGPAAAQGWKVAEPRDSALGGSWWELYRDPELSALEGRVAISNQTVVAAEANYRASRALVTEAQAALFPNLSLDPAVTRSHGSSSGGPTGQPGITHTLYTLPAEASYELDLWGRVRNAVAQSRLNAEISAADVATALLSTRSQLAQDYFQLRALDEQRRILDTTLADYEASLHLVDTLYRNGLASEEDLAEADTQLDTAEAQATDLGVARAQLEHAIAVLIGVSPAQFSMPVRPFNPALPVIPVGLPSDLLERRPDIAVAEREVASANAGIGIARAGFFPSLSLGATAGYTSTGLSQLFNLPNRFWSVGPAVTLPLFEGGALWAASAQAHAVYDQTVANYRQTVLAAFQSVEDNLSTLRILSKEVVQQHRAALAAQHEVQLTVARYQQGLDSYVNVITAQNSFLTNREAELQVELRAVAASISLINNLGGGWGQSQLGQTESTAKNPPAAAIPAEPPPENGGPGIPNPAPLPNGVKHPEDLLRQNAEDMAPNPVP